MPRVSGTGNQPGSLFPAIEPIRLPAGRPILCIIVDAEDTTENRQFIVEYKPTLLQRFEQIEMYIASYLIEVI